MKILFVKDKKKLILNNYKNPNNQKILIYLEYLNFNNKKMSAQYSMNNLITSNKYKI